jgi:hypothetical protein
LDARVDQGQPAGRVIPRGGEQDATVGVVRIGFQLLAADQDADKPVTPGLPRPRRQVGNRVVVATDPHVGRPERVVSQLRLGQVLGEPDD